VLTDDLVLLDRRRTGLGQLDGVDALARFEGFCAAAGSAGPA
jgi:hypothetical protein